MRSETIRARRGRTRLVAAGLVGVLALAACGDDADSTEATDPPATDPASESPAPGDDGAPSVETRAAELRAGLTSLLQEHVYLAGIATGTALAGGELEPAAATLDENSVALSDAIGSVYGDDAGEQFLELWRAHIGMFVDYTNGVAAGDDAAQQAARDELDAYGEDFAAFLGSANPNIDPEVIVAGLEEHVATLTAAIDAQAAGDPSQFSNLRAAAQHMPMVATLLAGAIVEQFPEDFSG